MQDIWDVLTDYERLPEFVPNLAVSERLQMPPEAPARLVRLRQVTPLHLLMPPFDFVHRISFEYGVKHR